MHYSMPISQRLKKLIKSLHHKQFRDQNALFIAEGEKLAEELVNSEYYTELVVVKDSPNSNVVDLVDKFVDTGVAIYTAPKHQFDQICDAKSPQNIIAVVSKQEMEIDTNKPVIVLDGISDPGNLGTIIRTADWFGYDQIILGPECADCYNPKAIRSTMGSIFKTSIVRENNIKHFISENLKDHLFYGASVNSKTNIEKIKPKSDKYGIIFGSESHGISDELSDLVDEEFIIGGKGNAESLNVAVAAGITLFNFSKV